MLDVLCLTSENLRMQRLLKFAAADSVDQDADNEIQSKREASYKQGGYILSASPLIR